MKVLLTGGLGYIGSHIAVELLEQNYEVFIIDNLSNSNKRVLNKIKKITGKKPVFYFGDVRNIKLLNKIFLENNIDTVIHLAGFKAVGESVKLPINYYDNNFVSTVKLLQAMEKHNVKNLIFSSSATVYSKSDIMPLTEEFPLSASSPYGRTKLFIEEMLKDLSNANKDMNIILLRYFNPLGAHKSGLIGEDPNGIPNNLMPFITKVALGKLEKLNIFGNTYNTKDGTGVRDYIHVVDLAKGHVKAVEKTKEKAGLLIYNLGTGVGCSVFDVVHSFEKATGIKINYQIAPKREGDIDFYYASSAKAQKELNWQPECSLEEMCKSAYEFEKFNTKKVL